MQIAQVFTSKKESVDVKRESVQRDEDSGDEYSERRF